MELRSGTMTLIEALDKRHGFFHEMGCRLSDHGLDRFYFSSFTTQEIDSILRNCLKGNHFIWGSWKIQTAVMLSSADWIIKGLTQQFHVGALRTAIQGCSDRWDRIQAGIRSELCKIPWKYRSFSVNLIIMSNLPKQLSIIESCR